jgi:HAE1 family hydrophobic/amphiphilic exporter-1
MSKIAGASPRLNQIDLVTQILTGGNQNVEVNIFGPDLDVLARLGKEVTAAVRDVSGYQNVDVNWQDSTPEIQWKVDRAKATQLGLSFQDIATTIAQRRTEISRATFRRTASSIRSGSASEERRKTVETLLSLPLTPSVVLATRLGHSGRSARETDRPLSFVR